MWKLREQTHLRQRGVVQSASDRIVSHDTRGCIASGLFRRSNPEEPCPSSPHEAEPVPKRLVEHAAAPLQVKKHRVVYSGNQLRSLYPPPRGLPVVRARMAPKG